MVWNKGQDIMLYIVEVFRSLSNYVISSLELYIKLKLCETKVASVKDKMYFMHPSELPSTCYVLRVTAIRRYMAKKICSHLNNDIFKFVN